jgi:hypothetical protein
MAEEYTLDDLLQSSQGKKDSSAPKRHKVLAKDSTAYIREDLIAYGGLYNVLKPYRDKYKWWQYQFLCHVVLSSVDDMVIHGDPPGISIPWNAIIRSLPSMTKDNLEELIRDGLISRDYYDQANHKSYWYFMGEHLSQQVEGAYGSKSVLDMLREGVCSLITGRPQSPLPTILFTKGKNGTKGCHEPPLIKQSFGMIRRNCVNVRKLNEAFEALKYKIAEFPHPDQKRTLQYRLMGNQRCLETLLRQGLTLDRDTGIGTYVPAYKPSTTGRMFEIGGGCQALSRKFKKAAYDLPGLMNYDIRSSQVTALLELGGKYGLDPRAKETLTEYIGNKDSKKEYAQQVGMDEDLWKQCLLSLFFGASTEKTRRISADETIQCSIYSEIIAWCNKNDELADPDHLLTNFCEVAKHFIKVQETWLRLIEQEILPKERYRREKTLYLDNAVGKTKVIPNKIDQQILREVSAFLLQGLEAAFIYTLITLSEQYGYEVRSCEHDGLITYGSIPKEFA